MVAPGSKGRASPILAHQATLTERRLRDLPLGATIHGENLREQHPCQPLMKRSPEALPESGVGLPETIMRGL
jgi:hypothetical protein